jgi:hypothetical protein
MFTTYPTLLIHDFSTLGPYALLKFSPVASRFFHNTAHLFADSRLATVHTSLVALTQDTIRILRGFTATLFSYASLVVLPVSFLFSGFPAKILYAYFLRHIHLSATCPTHLILLRLIT